MSTTELIEKVLSQIKRDFYQHRPDMFFRDRQALLRAVSRYGVECEAKGWAVEPDFICSDLLILLNRVAAHKADVDYLPVYLHSAVSKHIGQRAEEISKAAKAPQARVTRVMQGLNRVDAIVEPTTVEVLSKLYASLSRKKTSFEPKPAKQKELL